MCKILKKNEEFNWDDAYRKSWEWMKKHPWHVYLYQIRMSNSMYILMHPILL
jgi:hypothetical protein